VVNFSSYDLHIMTTKHRRTQYTFTLTTLHYQSNTMKLHACNLFTTEKMFTNYDFQITFNYDNQPDPMSLSGSFPLSRLLTHHPPKLLKCDFWRNLFAWRKQLMLSIIDFKRMPRPSLFRTLSIHIKEGKKKEEVLLEGVVM